MPIAPNHCPLVYNYNPCWVLLAPLCFQASIVKPSIKYETLFTEVVPLPHSYAANAGFEIAWDLNALRMRTLSNTWNATFAEVTENPIARD